MRVRLPLHLHIREASFAFPCVRTPFPRAPSTFIHLKPEADVRLSFPSLVGWRWAPLASLPFVASV